MRVAASMTVVPGFTTTSRPSMVAVTIPGFLGGGGAGGPGGLGAAAGASGFFSSAIPNPPSAPGEPSLLDLAADHVDGVEHRDQVREQRPLEDDRQGRQHGPAGRAQP